MSGLKRPLKKIKFKKYSCETKKKEAFFKSPSAVKRKRNNKRQNPFCCRGLKSVFR